MRGDVAAVVPHPLRQPVHAPAEAAHLGHPRGAGDGEPHHGLALLRRDLLRQPAGPGAGDPPGGGPLPVHHRPAAGQLRPALPADLLPLSGHGGPYPGLFRGELPGDGAVSRPVHPADASAGHAPGHPAQRGGPAAQPVDAGGHRPLPPGPAGDGGHGGVADHPVRRSPPPLARAGAVLGQRPAPPGGGGGQPGVAGAAEGLGLSPAAGVPDGHRRGVRPVCRPHPLLPKRLLPTPFGGEPEPLPHLPGGGCGLPHLRPVLPVRPVGCRLEGPFPCPQVHGGRTCSSSDRSSPSSAPPASPWPSSA